jgi:PAS domain S-box-containing protein
MNAHASERFRRPAPTQREVWLEENELIVSKTDSRGRITYANRIFMRLTDYREDELLGRAHSIVRHPDMPRGLFKLVWDTIGSGDECFAYMKNLCRNGDHYWVFVNITADLDATGNAIGYYSVRRRPRKEALDRIIPIYSEMLAIEARSAGSGAPEASLKYLQELIKSRGETYETFVLGL